MAYAQDAIQIIEWYGGRIYSIEGGTGVYKAVEGGPDKTFLCLEIHNRTPGSGAYTTCIILSSLWLCALWLFALWAEAFAWQLHWGGLHI